LVQRQIQSVRTERLLENIAGKDKGLWSQSPKLGMINTDYY